MSDTAYRIVADTAVNAGAVAAVQAVPLIWEPHTGPDAWGPGDPVRTSAPGVRPPTFSATAVYWGVTGNQFQDEASAIATLQSAGGVTVTEE